MEITKKDLEQLKKNISDNAKDCYDKLLHSEISFVQAENELKDIKDMISCYEENSKRYIEEEKHRCELEDEFKAIYTEFSKL